MANGRKCGDTGGLNRWGDPCKREVAEGYTRCAQHGAKSPSAIAKAEQALALARMPAIEHLYDMLEQYAKDTCPTCNYPRRDSEQARVELALCKAVLDRTGLPPRVGIEVTTKNEDGLNMDLLTTEERTEVFSMASRMKAIKAAVRARTLGTLTNTDMVGSTFAAQAVREAIGE